MTIYDFKDGTWAAGSAFAGTNGYGGASIQNQNVHGLSLLDTNSEMETCRHDSPNRTKGVSTINHFSGNAC